MPCSDGYPSNYDYEYEKQKVELKRRLDLSTRLLCGLLTQLTTTPIVDIGTMERLFKDVPGLREWWTQHQKEDAARERRERKELLRKIKQLRSELSNHSRKKVEIRAQLQELETSIAVKPKVKVKRVSTAPKRTKGKN